MCVYIWELSTDIERKRRSNYEISMMNLDRNISKKEQQNAAARLNGNCRRRINSS